MLIAFVLSAVPLTFREKKMRLEDLSMLLLLRCSMQMQFFPWMDALLLISNLIFEILPSLYQGRNIQKERLYNFLCCCIYIQAALLFRVKLKIGFQVVLLFCFVKFQKSFFRHMKENSTHAIPRLFFCICENMAWIRG